MVVVVHCIQHGAKQCEVPLYKGGVLVKEALFGYRQTSFDLLLAAEFHHVLGHVGHLLKKEFRGRWR